MINTVFNENCLDTMNRMQNDFVDVVITSPPYDGLRKNNDYCSVFDFESIAKELCRVTKDGGVVVWVVNDETKKFCESLTSFKQAIYFVDSCGFNLLDTMIYKKKSYPPAYPTLRRYASVFEYMFVFCKGKPKTFNQLRENKSENSIGGESVISTFRQKDGSIKQSKTNRSKKDKARTNVWEYITGNHPSEDKIKFKHPATFPNDLAKDHILTWSNPGDIVFDPMAGAGTTLKMAKETGRQWVGSEISDKYCAIIRSRLC